MTTADLLSTSGPALAVGDEMLVNTNLQTTKNTVSITQLAGGGNVVVWHSSNQDGDAGGIFGQLLAADGTALGAEFQINQDGNQDQYFPTVAATPDGGFIVNWQTRDSAFSEWDVSAQRFDSAAARMGGQITVAESSGSGMVQSDLTVLESGKFIVSWQDFGTRDIVARVFNPDDNSVFPRQTDVSLQRFALEPDTGMLVIDQSGTMVTNTVVRFGEPAALITGSDNTLTNESGAGLIGTEPSGSPEQLDPAIEITGSGNTIVNEAGAFIDGDIGVDSLGPDTTVINAGAISGVNILNSGFVDDGFGLRLGGDRSVVHNTGRIWAESLGDKAVAVLVINDSTVANAGMIQVNADEQATGIVGVSGNMIVNTATGEIDIVGDRLGYGINVSQSGNQIENAGSIRVSAIGSFSGFDGYGVRANFSNAIVNTGSIEIDTPSGGAGIWTVGGQNTVDNQGTITVVSTGGDRTRADGLRLTSGQASNSGTITVESTGGRATGVNYLNDGDFINDGRITVTGGGADVFGVDMGTHGSVINNGTIEAVATAGQSVGLEFDTGSLRTTQIVNTGTITADFAIRSAFNASPAFGNVQNVTNSGIINGLIELDESVDTISNTGTINGNVFLDEGDDVFDGVEGTVNGSIFGASGSDTITNRGTINGVVFLGDGDDVYDGSMGTLFGSVIGALGNDTISGGLGVEALFGGAGDDILSGNAGDDFLVGGAGADMMDGGDGFDALDYSDSQAGVQVNLGDATQAGNAPVPAGAGTAFGGDAEGDTFSSIEAVIGSAFGDFVFGNADGNLVQLGAGDDEFDNWAALSTADVLEMGAGDDIARAGNGDDWISGGAGDDNLRGQRGDDIIFGDEGNDLLFGDAGQDTLDGGAGDDRVFGGRSSDVLTGGGGDDVLIGGAGADAMDGGAGFDTLDYSASQAGVQVNLGDATQAGNAPVPAGAGTAFGGDAEGDTFSSIEAVIGSAFGDFVFGNADGNLVQLGAGDDEFDNWAALSTADVLEMGAGDDIARAGNGDDWISGGAGDDNLRGQRGDDIIFGDEGNDLLFGDAGQDTLDGGAGDDRVFGGRSSDVLTGGGGDDVLIGGAGADAMDGGAGFDTLDYSASQAGVQVNLGDATQAGNAPVPAGAGTAFGGDAEGDTFSGIEAVIGSAFGDFVYGNADGNLVQLGAGDDEFDNWAALSTADVIEMGAGDDIARAGDGDDLISGGSGNDNLRGQRGNDIIFGDEGDDRLFGHGGRDTLHGGAGNDKLRGGGGNDLLLGGGGDDDLFGNGGSDTFVFDLDGGADRIFGFTAGSNSVDVIDLTAFDAITTFDDVLSIATEVGNDTVLELDMTSTLTLVGIDVNQLDSGDFVFA